MEEYFPGTSQVALLELDEAFDIDIWRYAANNDFVIVTKDSDFEELSVLHGAPPKVIWIKSGNTNNKNLLKVLIDNQCTILSTLAGSDINCLEIY